MSNLENSKNAVNEFLRSIKYMIDEAINKTTKVYSGRVVSIGQGKCTVEMNGSTVSASYSGNNIAVGSVVHVIIPQGNINMAYISESGGGSSPSPTPVPGSGVTSVNGKTGVVVINKTDIGLGNVPNVSTNSQTPTFIKANTRTNIASGETLATIFGKVMKWFGDLGDLAFKSKIIKTDLDNDIVASLNKADSALQVAPVTSVNGQTGDVTVSGYTPPTGGIPKTDLSANVQASLNKADTALQIAPVVSVNGQTGEVNLDAGDIGYGESNVSDGIADAKAKAEEAETIAKGRATGYVFDTKADMDAWLENPVNKAKLVLGDNLYIRATDTPDYWWDGSNAQQLETQKVDLSEYAKTADIPTELSELTSDSTHRTVTDAEKTAWNGKQNAINDLANIRAGAALGATALQNESDPTVPNWAKQPNKPTYTKSEVGLGNVENERQYSANNPPPYPVTSVNGQTGDVVVSGGGGLVYEDSGGINITWDGDTTGRDVLMVIDDLSNPIGYKVSDNIYGADDLIGATIVVDEDGTLYEDRITECIDIDGFVMDEWTYIFSGSAGTYNYGSVILSLPSDGTYFAAGEDYAARSLKKSGTAKLIQGGEDVTKMVSDLVWATINIPNANGVSF